MMMMNRDDTYSTRDIMGDNTVDDECEDKICTFTKRGICERHLVQGTKQSIHTKNRAEKSAEAFREQKLMIIPFLSLY